MSVSSPNVARSARREGGWRRRRATGVLGAVGTGLLLSLALVSSASAVIVPTVGLGTAAQFSVLAGTTVTNVGPTTMSGSLGVSPGSAATGFPPGAVTPPGVIHLADAVALQAQSDLVTAYNNALGRPVNAIIGVELGGQVLQGGVYASTPTKGPLQLTGTVTLDGAGDPDSVWIFQTDSTLTTATDSVVALVNGASACNVFWQIGSSATLGTRTTFVGTLLTLTTNTLGNGVTVDGRALARNGAVTLINDTFTGPDCTPSSASTTSTTASTSSTTGGGTGATDGGTGTAGGGTGATDGGTGTAGGGAGTAGGGTGGGGGVTTTTNTSLPRTGSNVAPSVAAGVIAVALGAGLVGLEARRRRSMRHR